MTVTECPVTYADRALVPRRQAHGAGRCLREGRQAIWRQGRRRRHAVYWSKSCFSRSSRRGHVESIAKIKCGTGSLTLAAIRQEDGSYSFRRLRCRMQNTPPSPVVYYTSLTTDSLYHLQDVSKDRRHDGLCQYFVRPWYAYCTV